MKNFILISFILTLSIEIKAQHDISKSDSTNVINDIKPIRQVKTVSYPIQMIAFDENDEYYGRKNEFSQMFISNALPDDFPKYKSGTNVDDYIGIVNNYLTLNNNLLIEKYKVKYK